MIMLGTVQYAVTKRLLGIPDRAAHCKACSLPQLPCSAGFPGMILSRQMWPGTSWPVSCSGL